MEVGQDLVLSSNKMTSKIMSVQLIKEKGKFCNFKTTNYKKSTFVANGVIVEGLNDWTDKFMEWVHTSGNYPKVEGE